MSQCQETPHIWLHCAVAVLSSSGDKDPLPMLGVGTPLSDALNPLWHPEEPWLWVQIGHIYTFLPWEVVVGELVCGRSLEEGDGRVHLSVQAGLMPSSVSK